MTWLPFSKFRYTEKVACDIINTLNMNRADGAEQSKEALQADYKPPDKNKQLDEVLTQTPYRKYLYKKFDGSKEIMAIAYKAKAMKFLSQRPCLNLIKYRKSWSNSSNWVPMKLKFLFHAIMRFVYIGCFVHMLCAYPVYDRVEIHSSREIFSFSWYYVLLVLIAQASMTFFKWYDATNFKIYKLKEKHRKMERKKVHLQYINNNKLTFRRSWFIIPLLILEASRFFRILYVHKSKESKNAFRGAWSFWPIVLEVLYCVLFSIATLTSLRFFLFFDSIGFFIRLFKKTWKTVLMFVSIFCTFWFVLAVVHVSVSRTLLFTNNTFLYSITHPGKFEIFGEVQDADRLGILTNCSDYNRTIFDIGGMEYAEASCLIRGTLLPFLMFTYIFVSGILLVNFLTAQLTKEYEKEVEKSQYYKGYLRYEQLAKIESKYFLPPPFSLIYVFARIIFFLMSPIFFFIWLILSFIQWIFRCCKCCEPIYRSSCESCCCECSLLCCCLYLCWPTIQYFIWKNIIRNTEGYPFQSAHGKYIGDGVREAMKKKLNISPNDVPDRLRNIVNLYHRQTLGADDLRKLKNSLNRLLDECTVEEEIRAQSRMAVQQEPGVFSPLIYIPTIDEEIDASSRNSTIAEEAVIPVFRSLTD